jgi:hypothetical protein
MRVLLLALMNALILFGCGGCRGEDAVQGSVKFSSTAPFNKLKGMKSPSPQIPK